MPLKLTELKKELKEYDQKELITLISELYKLDPVVKNYLSVKFQGNETVEILFTEARKKIKNVFFPERGFSKLSLATAKKAISDFRKLTRDEERTADLLIYYVELGTEFSATYGDINESFYESMVNTFAQAVKMIDTSYERVDSYDDRFQALLNNARNIGWGYPEVLDDIYWSMQFKVEEEE